MSSKQICKLASQSPQRKKKKKKLMSYLYKWQHFIDWENHFNNLTHELNNFSNYWTWTSNKQEKITTRAKWHGLKVGDPRGGFYMGTR